METILSQAGLITVEECMILKPGQDGVNIIQQLASITLYEDLYSPFITGQVILSDTGDIPNLIGRGGKDILKLKLYTPTINKENYIEAFFMIYKIGDRFNSAERFQHYTLFIVSEEYFQDTSKRISKTYSDNANKIVSNILTDTLSSTKKFNTTGDSSVIKYTSNFWSPSKNFRYITDHAVDDKGSPSLLFFENRYGFNLHSLDHLIDKTNSPPIQSFMSSDYSINMESNSDNQLSYGQAQRDPSKDFQIIQDIRVDKIFNFFDDYAAGMIKTKMYSHDISTKRLNIKKYEMIQDTGPRLNTNRPYRDEIVSNVDPVLMFMTQHNNSHDKGDSTDFNIKQKRIIRLRQMYSQTIEIDVFGRTDYTVGKKVNVFVNRLVPLIKTDTEDDYTDKIYSGVYIITAITHKINRDRHLCVLELSKNSTDLM